VLRPLVQRIFTEGSIFRMAETNAGPSIPGMAMSVMT
jgi:hypothetical protein